MHFGSEPGTLLTDADLVIVLEADVPWIPSLQQPTAGARVVHVGEDPVFSRYPMRSFPSSLTIQSGTANALDALHEALHSRLQMAEPRIATRRARLTERMRMRRAQLAKDAATATDKISPEYLSHAIGEAVGPDAVIFNEYPLRGDHCAREHPGT
jgi:acetolactate synthase-1/2/3 large subunit